MTLRCTNHCRNSQKNLFLGEELLFFAKTPDSTTDDGATPPAGGAATPVGATPVQGMVDAKANPENQIQATPESQKDKLELRKKKSKLWDEMVQMVPEKMEYLPNYLPDGSRTKGNSMEMMEDWMKSLADCNEIQNYIDRLSHWEEEIKDPKKLTDDTAARFKERYKEVYSELLAVRALGETFKIKGGPDVDWEAVKNKAMGRVEVTTREVMVDLEKAKKVFLEQRKIALENLRERALHSFQLRLAYLKNEWQNNPPHGYEAGKDSWIRACDAFLKEAATFPGFDADNPDFPEGSKVAERLNQLWRGIDNMELTLAEYRKGQFEGGKLSIIGLKQRLDGISAKKDEIFGAHTYGEHHHDSFEDWHKSVVQSVLKRLDDVIPLYEKRVASVVKDKSVIARYCQLKKDYDEVSGVLTNNPNDEAAKARKKTLQLEIEGFKGKPNNLSQDQMELLQHLAGLQALRASIQASGNLDEVFTRAIENTETYTPEGGETPYPKGIRAQLDWIEKINVSPEQRNQMMYRFSQVLDKLESDITGAEDYIQSKLGVDLFTKINTLKYDLEHQEAEPKWQLHLMSGFKTYETIEHTITSIFERSWKRDDQLKTGMWGKEAFAFLEDIPVPLDAFKPIQELKGEMEIEEEHAMMEDIGHWSKQHEHASDVHLFHRMNCTKNHYEFRAVIELLCKKGLMRLLDDENFFKQLNRFQSSVNVPISKYWHSENRFDSEDVLKRAVNAIYSDIDLFETWHSQVSSAIKSEGAQFNEEFGQVGNIPGGLVKLTQKLLDDYKKDIANPSKHGHSDVDPNKFEAALHYGIDNGKMDAEDILYYLLQGIAHGLLSFDRSAIFTNKNNNYPAIEFLDADTGAGGGKPTLLDVQEWAKIGEDRNNDYAQYLDWFHTVVMTNDKVVQRVNKAQSQGMRFDHDYFTGFAGHLNSSTIDGVLKMKGDGGFGLQVTAVQNGTVGMLFALDSLSEYYGNLGTKAKPVLSQMVDSIVRFDAIINARMYANDTNYFKIDNAALKSNPRYAGAYGIYGRGKMSTEDHLKIMRNYIAKLDVDPAFPLLEKLFNNQLKTPEDIQRILVPLLAKHKNALGEGKKAEDFKTVESIYMNLGVYLDYAIEQGEPLQKFLNAMKSDHQKVFMGKSNTRDVSIQAIRKKAQENRMSFKREHMAKMERSEMVEPDHHDHGAHGHGHGDGHGDEHGDEHGDSPHDAAHHRGNTQWHFSAPDGVMQSSN